MPKQNRIDLGSIRAARARIADAVRDTPMTRSMPLTELVGTTVYLKHEHRQTTGSFKLRGATNAVRTLSDAQRMRGVVAASTGNHGRALSQAAKSAGVQATICMSRLVPDNKVSEIRSLGGEIRIVGKSQDDAQEEVERLVLERGLTMVHPFDDISVIEGQATLGLDICAGLSEPITVLVPLSGGGLAAGVASAVKNLDPRSKVIGITMENGAAMHASLAAGRPVQVEEVPSLADSLGGGIGLDNRWTFEICRDLLDDVILLSEDDILAGIRHAFVVESEIVEGAAAVGIAALLAGRVTTHLPIVSILTGANIDRDVHRRLVAPATSQG